MPIDYYDSYEFERAEEESTTIYLINARTDGTGDRVLVDWFTLDEAEDLLKSLTKAIEYAKLWDRRR